MAKQFHRGPPRRGPPRHGPAGSRPERGQSHHGPDLGPRGDGLWLHGVHPVLAALGNPERTVRRLLITAEVAERLSQRLETALSARNGQPKPEIVDRRALDNLARGAVHQGIALEAEPLPEV